MPVLMQLKGQMYKIPEQVQTMWLLSVESFQAKDVVRVSHFVIREAVVSQEWRIPEYSYTLNVPMYLLGRKNAEEKERDDLMKRLSLKDRQAFDQIPPKCLAADEWVKEEPLRRLLVPYERKLQELERQMKEAKKEMSKKAKQLE